MGDVTAKNLLAYCGSAKDVFKQKKGLLTKIPGVGGVIANNLCNGKTVLQRAEEELKFIEQYKIKPLFFTDENYPKRLKNCSDGPIMLYYKGNANLNCEKIVAVVGSRKPSEYGKQITEEFVKELKDSGILIVSGLAYGVDILSHKVALDIGLNTVGVLGHGLDRIYPHAHERIAKKMIDQGGLLTDFISQTNPDAVNFPKRNRIVAGMCDALVIVESKQKGGSLITATIANSYNKDVFAFPGRAGDALAEGCNGLIKQNKAGLIENAADLLHALQWENITNKNNKQIQVPLMLNINEEEKRILDAFSSKKELHIDEVCYLCGLTISKVAATLLQLEFNGIIKSKPGKMYLCNV
ncbi:MAG: DNA-processing protein DprA [Bacteroidetes bacterium]|nr:DNA-processing protein DprA [Bacteroidota bacterium]